MINVVATVCLIAQPTQCKEVRLAYEGELTGATQCMMMAMPELAKWQNGNPQWRVQKFSCLGKRKAKETAI